MDTTKASAVSVLLLLVIVVLQVCRMYSQELGIGFFNPADRNHVLLVNVVSSLLGIAIPAVWWVCLFVSRSNGGRMGRVAVKATDLIPDGKTGGSKTQSRAPRAATGGGASVCMDIACMQITLSDGKSRQRIRLRVDCPQETRLSIGNSPNCGIRIQDNTMAPHHADLLIRSCNIRLHNPGNNNGIRVGTTMLPSGETSAVSRGQHITLGGVVLRID